MALLLPSPTQDIPRVNRLQLGALVVGAVGLVLLVIGAIFDLRQFFESYLFGYIVCMSLPLGCFGLMLLQHLTGGAWGLTTRRMFEAGAITMPIMALLFIPIAVGTFGIFGNDLFLYEWANPTIINEDPIIERLVPWLNPWTFTLRAALYFGIWIGISYLLRRWSLSQDRDGDDGFAKRMRMLSGIGLALFVITVTFASFDWGMSLDPHWFSTIYGALYMIGTGLMTLSFTLVVVALVARTPLFERYVTVKPVHDLGKLLFAFLVLWTYMSFGQFVIIWSGDVAEFTPWYLHRIEGGWQWFVISLMVFSFLIPFFILLSRSNKRNINVLAGTAIFIMFMRLVDLAWTILPEFHASVSGIHWMDIVAPLGLIGIWIFLFARGLRSAPLLPLNDPGMENLVDGGGGH